MNFSDQFPLAYCINLGERDDRRAFAEREFFQQNLAVLRFPAINKRWLKSNRGFEDTGRYALAITQRLLVRKARNLGADSVVLFEDDVVLHPQFQELWNNIVLPDDWGILYLGCTHVEKPEFVSPGLVRCKNAIDTHAIIIRDRCFQDVLSALKSDPSNPEKITRLASDRLLVPLQKIHPTYACLPNLAWQRKSRSDLLDYSGSNYELDGFQRNNQEAPKGTMSEVLGGVSFKPDSSSLQSAETPKPAFLFLTRGNINHPEFWAQYFKDSLEEPLVFLHPKEPEAVETPWLRKKVITNQVQTAWGEISLVNATLELLRSGLAESDATHFILLSESCLPIKPMSDLLDYLKHDPRSMFEYQPNDEIRYTNLPKAQRIDAAPRIPSALTYAQSQWMILTREIAELICEYDFTKEFENVFAADESYFATILNIMGVPLDQYVRNLCPTYQKRQHFAPHPESILEIDSSLLLDWKFGPHFFARKFEKDFEPNWKL